MRRAISILYHDVVAKGGDDVSGFPGSGAGVYKLQVDDFRNHLAEIRQAISRSPDTIRAWTGNNQGATPLFLTFDDGGVSAYHCIADLLEDYGWRGHFFVTTDYIGTPPFMTAEQIRELHNRGHSIGSHSCSHPDPMSNFGYDILVSEWTRSIQILSDIIGEPVRLASLPGGSYSLKVARAASQAGIRALFTSEPRKRTWRVDDCLVLGRYTVYRGMPPCVSAGFAQDWAMPQLKQYLWWNTKKAAKTLGGPLYMKLRGHLLSRK